MPIEPGLYVTATPIGNLKDVTYRVIETLKAADQILCEDTRQTAKLCAAYGVETPRRPYHEHNADRVLPEILAALQGGATLCLVSDAGTPLISDPGYRLVRRARDAGVKVTPLPGPAAFVAALSAAGAPTDRFTFAGFPPSKAVARGKFFAGLSPHAATLVFYESPSRLADSLAAMAEAFGERRACVAREITKLHEEFREDSLAGLAEHYREARPKGEIVVIVHPPKPQGPPDETEIDAFLAHALERQSVKEAAAVAAITLGVSKNLAYSRALFLKDKK